MLDDVTVLNTVTRPLPFLIGDGEGGDSDAPREELRLRHRVLDLRRDFEAGNAVVLLICGKGYNGELIFGTVCCNCFGHGPASRLRGPLTEAALSRFVPRCMFTLLLAPDGYPVRLAFLHKHFGAAETVELRIPALR